MLRTIPLEEIELNVFDAGTGHPVLFVHGFPLNHSMWRFQLEEFSKTHRVIAPDLRGFGQSEDSANVSTMPVLADDCAAVLDALQIDRPVTLCGLSMGGYVAWQFWKRHPDRLHRLVLCDTRAAADSPEVRQGRRASSDRVLKQGTAFLAESMIEKLFSPKTTSQQPDLVRDVQQMILTNSPQGVSAALLGMAARPDVTDWLPEINIPSLVIVGAADPISPVDEMRAIATALPQSSLQIIPDAGHMSPLEQPAIVNQHLRQFLRA